MTARSRKGTADSRSFCVQAPDDPVIYKVHGAQRAAYRVLGRVPGGRATAGHPVTAAQRDQYELVAYFTDEFAHIGDALTLAEVAFRLEGQSVRFRNVGRQHVTPWTTPKGGAVFLPNSTTGSETTMATSGPIIEACCSMTCSQICRRPCVWNLYYISRRTCLRTCLSFGIPHLPCGMHC